MVSQEHGHNMVLDTDVDGRHWFFCEHCTALVEIVPIIRRVGGRTRVIASTRLVSDGNGGLAPGELVTLAQFWMAYFRSFVSYRQDRESDFPGSRLSA